MLLDGKRGYVVYADILPSQCYGFADEKARHDAVTKGLQCAFKDGRFPTVEEIGKLESHFDMNVFDV
jgi:hypothetical protein